MEAQHKLQMSASKNNYVQFCIKYNKNIVFKKPIWKSQNYFTPFNLKQSDTIIIINIEMKSLGKKINQKRKLKMYNLHEFKLKNVFMSLYFYFYYLCLHNNFFFCFWFLMKGYAGFLEVHFDTKMWVSHATFFSVCLFKWLCVSVTLTGSQKFIALWTVYNCFSTVCQTINLYIF